jgi:hypothetical protein
VGHVRAHGRRAVGARAPLGDGEDREQLRRAAGRHRVQRDVARIDITEVEWLRICEQLTAVTTAAGTAEQIAERTCCFYASMVLFILGFMTCPILLSISCTLQGWGLGCKIGVAVAAVTVVCMIAFIALMIAGAKAGQRWTTGAIQAVDSQLLPDLRARYSLMVFELRDLRKFGFTLMVQRVPEGRDSLGQVVVPGVAVAAVAAPMPVAPAPMAEAVADFQTSKGGGGGLGAPLLGGE